jgi:hypothetical protein
MPEMADDALPPSASSTSIHNEVREDMRKTRSLEFISLLAN